MEAEPDCSEVSAHEFGAAYGHGLEVGSCSRNAGTWLRVQIDEITANQFAILNNTLIVVTQSHK